jgi:DNA mismatch repair protein MutS
LGTRHLESPPVQVREVAEPELQLSLFSLDDPVLSQVRDTVLELDIDRLTPVEALLTLHQIRGVLTGKGRG